MNEVMIIQGVKGRLNENGIVELNLEHVARGLGFLKRDNKGSVNYWFYSWKRQLLL